MDPVNLLNVQHPSEVTHMLHAWLHISMHSWNTETFEFRHIELQNGAICATIHILTKSSSTKQGEWWSKTPKNRNHWTDYLHKSQDSVHIVGSADLCLKSPVGAVVDESVAAGGAHSSAYCLTATASIWQCLWQASPLLPRGASDRWATRGPSIHSARRTPTETEQDHFTNAESAGKNSSSTNGTTFHWDC